MDEIEQNVVISEFWDTILKLDKIKIIEKLEHMDRTYSFCQDCKNLSAPYLIVYKLYSKTLATFKFWYIYLILSWLVCVEISGTVHTADKYV